MRSLADRVRVERLLRTTGYVAVVLWIALAVWPRGRDVAVLRGAALAESLARVTRAVSPDSVHVQIDTVPDATHRSWLEALRRAGVGLSWSAPSLDPIAIETFRSVDPAGGVVVLAAAPRAAVVSDALGPVDTIGEARGPTALRLASVEGDVTLSAGRQPARADAGSARAPRRLLVTGRAGWESKFVVAALEESGWIVDARVSVRPDHDVVQGGGASPTLDTARYAAAVLMDSLSAERVPGLDEFVRSGGGLVLAGDANRARRIAGLVAWRPGTRETAPLGTLPGDTAWRGQSRIALDSVAGRHAITLEQRSGTPVVAARRHYAGRVVGIGYDETWRWRMAGDDNAVARHREWWSRAVGAVAARPGDGSLGSGGAAPLATLHQALGGPSAPPPAIAGRLPTRLIVNLLGVVALAAFLGEWLSRRARGAR